MENVGFFVYVKEHHSCPDEKLTPAQVSKMQKSLEQARMLMKNLGRPRAKAGAKAKAEPKAPPKVEAKAGDKRKR